MLAHWLVSYDIADARTRLKAAQLLLNHGERVQESVYELRLHPGQWQRLKRRLTRLIDPEQDQWRAYPLCVQDRADAIELGVPARHPPQQALLV
jgi:CRISPR-associated endonuclease Cas2